MEKVIQISHAVKRFGKTTVLHDVSLNIDKGSICGIIGRNGSGKTVLFKAVCGFHQLTSGTITVKGKRVSKDVDIPEGIGSIIETPGFLGNFSGYRNLKYLADIRGIIGKEEIYQAMEQVGLDPKSRKHVGKYSLGMRQRLGLAQAFMEGQDILVLDEPMNGLDNQGVNDIRELLLELKKQGKTILMASHNREDIEKLCDEVYEMDAGILKKR
ncbi:MAG: ATP-binding cassette domain-containing protein [Lachnospiraceae bacterium]|jgi:ABC-2 type transport system ATP-binding protein|nr:ATP-binding cassette domain-containing protein [Lachnospiraceae bacterium]